MVDFPKTKTTKAKVKKPLGPIKMYVVYKGAIETLELRRNKRDVLDIVMAAQNAGDTSLKVKEFTFERTARDTNDAA